MLCGVGWDGIKMTHKQVSQYIIKKTCHEVLISYNDCISERRDIPTRHKRILVCLLLDRAGYSLSAISRAVKKHHTTVLNMIDDDFRARRGLKPNVWILKQHRARLRELNKVKMEIPERLRKK